MTQRVQDMATEPTVHEHKAQDEPVPPLLDEEDSNDASFQPVTWKVEDCEEGRERFHC